jgi:hypothetical protein
MENNNPKAIITVKELKDFLHNLPDDAIVDIYDSEGATAPYPGITVQTSTGEQWNIDIDIYSERHKKIA